MRAGIVNPYWDSFGGGERYTASVVKYLLDQGWQVDIQWPQNISSSIHSRFGLDISQASYISHLSSRIYDLVFWVSDGSLPVSFAKKTLVHFQIPFRHVGGSRPANLLKSRFYKFVANSRFTKEIVDQEFHIKSLVLYPPIDTSQFTAGKKENIIFYIGRFSSLTQVKGQTALISSFSRIFSQIPGWKLVLAGGVGVGTSDSDIQNLQNQAGKLPVEFILNPSFSQVRQLVSRGQIFWSASGYSSIDPVRAEHFGITVVEAMAAGAVPVITNLGGHREIVQNSVSGYLWNRPDELEKFTLDLIRHPSHLNQLAKQAVKRSKMFDISVFNRDLAKLL